MYWPGAGAHTCNPSYSRGRDQEDHGSKLAGANSSQDPILQKPFTKRAGGVVQGEGPEFKPQYHKKKKKDRMYFHHHRKFPHVPSFSMLTPHL
jgi:hypothetical protein